MDRKSTKQGILDVTIMLIKEKGYENVSLADICKSANITKPTFYYYYSSKDDILSFLTMKTSANYSLLKVMATLNDPWQKLWVLSKGALDDLMLDYGKEVIKTAISVNIRKGRTPFELLTKEQEDLTVPLIKQCQELGIVRSKADAAALAYNGLIFFNGLVFMWAMGSIEDDIYQKLLEGTQVIYDIDPKYYFPLDMI